MDPLQQLKCEVERLVELSGADAMLLWTLAARCATLALPPAIAPGARWAPGLISMGTIALPGLGTLRGTTAAVVMMGNVWEAGESARAALLPGLLSFKDALASDPDELAQVRQEVQRIVAGR